MAKKLQVFISSTFIDLKEERQALVQTVLQAGHIPAGMELFTAGDRTQWETIKEWIGQSDVLVLLLGSRYGTIEPVSRQSYTHLEYLHAESLGKPAIGLVLSDDYCWTKQQSTARWSPETELQQYQEFRQYVMSKMCSSVCELKDITIATVTSLYSLMSRENLVGWIRGNEVQFNASLLSEISALREENTALKARVSALLTSVPQEKAVETALKLLRSFGYNEMIYHGKESSKGSFYTLDTWFLMICEKLGVWPYHLTVGQGFIFQTVAPRLANYGLLELQDYIAEPIFQGSKPTKWSVFVLTDLGKRVLAELTRGQLDRQCN